MISGSFGVGTWSKPQVSILDGQSSKESLTALVEVATNFLGELKAKGPFDVGNEQVTECSKDNAP